MSSEERLKKSKKECSLNPVAKEFKNILKKIFPTPFLKEAFLAYNKVRILTLDRILFPEFRVSEDQFLLYRIGYPFRENNISVDDLHSEKVRNYMREWNQWTQEEYILPFKTACWIEPDFGWAIVPARRLVYYSIGVSRTWFQRKPRIFKYLLRKKQMSVERAISLRDSGEENYFHFFNDVLSKIFFLQQHGIDIQQHSFIISNVLWNKAYFQSYLKYSPLLQSLRWIRQEDQYLWCKEVIFCKPLTHRKDLWNAILNTLPVPANTHGSKKIFLTRSKHRLRFIENIEAIENICRQSGFTIVDTDRYSLEEQIELFSQTRFLIGIHGAGLTNMIFRKPFCQVFELFPPPELGYLPYHYIMLAKMSGFGYQALIGSPGKIRYSGGFYIEPERFEKALHDLLANDVAIF